MYFPYLRGKKYDLLSLADCATMLAANGKIVPILEPVKEKTKELLKAVKHCIGELPSFVLVVNPQVGELKAQHSILTTELEKENIFSSGSAIAGFIISHQTTLREVEDFLSKFQRTPRVFIHSESFSFPLELLAVMGKHGNIAYQIFIDGPTKTPYHNLFGGYQRVLVRDGFRRMNNSAYPPDEFFSTVHQTYVDEGFRGFGDFTIVGQKHLETGYTPLTIAIHLTYRRPDNDIWIRHFVSDSHGKTKKKPGKFFEALDKLVRFLDQNPEVSGCTGCAAFLDLHVRQHYPELGAVKRLSINHHLELMARLV